MREKMRAADIALYANEALFRAGQEASHCYLLLEGSMTILPRDGSQPVRQCRSGELFGVPEVLSGGVWPGTALARSGCRVMAIPKSALFRSLSELPPAQKDFLAALAAEIS
jgi:CRP-like cAMP-binding protein